ncbi:MAG TPA: hypothetical protein VFQ45_09855, partial [Longimicrobium sp.]|nr:hypothetical protein [Longimicrobium sp.]
ERAWYVARGMPPPRDSALADVRELARVRGFAGVARLDQVLAVEPGRIPINHAPPEVLAALPGFTPELVGRVMETRARGERITDLQVLSGRLSTGAYGELMRAFAELSAEAAVEPDAWIVRARGQVGTPPVTAVVEVRLVRGGDRAGIVRRKTWVE